jgi:hypothetical protein
MHAAAAAQSSLHDSRGRPLVATQGRGLMPLALLPPFRASVRGETTEKWAAGEREKRGPFWNVRICLLPSGAVCVSTVALCCHTQTPLGASFDLDSPRTSPSQSDGRMKAAAKPEEASSIYLRL